jgi:hypothetical protein
VTLSIDIAKKMAGIFNTAFGYLLDETGQENVLKDPDMLKRLMILRRWYQQRRGHVLFALDALQKIKINNIDANKSKNPVYRRVLYLCSLIKDFNDRKAYSL